MLFFCIISQNGTIVYDDGSVLHILPVLFLSFLLFIKDYIIPIPGLAAGAGVSSLMIATADSVVSNVDATLVAF